MARLASVVRWCGGWRERRARRQKLLRRRQHSGGTVWLGRRRSCRLAVSRLVRWRLVAELLRPIRKALMEMVAATAAGAGSGPGRRQLVTLPQLNFPFVGTLTLPAVA
ncbi:hypothetical protein BAE44_0014626 [Dichanthelium oligosanthes]|uniref:Uncharacterized protein n=1 Tax=Dichanthelium oligosanthes TaxID=888268 RepID=A0A1E5VH12_9POAL|nr:hypothetical protein BAE44_0014626 [Dichanthelium oligosanthes]